MSVSPTPECRAIRCVTSSQSRPSRVLPCANRTSAPRWRYSPFPGVSIGAASLSIPGPSSRIRPQSQGAVDSAALRRTRSAAPSLSASIFAGSTGFLPQQVSRSSPARSSVSFGDMAALASRGEGGDDAVDDIGFLRSRRRAGAKLWRRSEEDQVGRFHGRSGGGFSGVAWKTWRPSVGGGGARIVIEHGQERLIARALPRRLGEAQADAGWVIEGGWVLAVDDAAGRWSRSATGGQQGENDIAAHAVGIAHCRHPVRGWPAPVRARIRRIAA